MRISKAKRVALVLMAGVAVLWPALLWAHARLTRSDPVAKSAVAIIPSVIRLWFSEAPEVALSTITLKDSAGIAIPLGAVTPDSSKLGLQARIDRPLVPGRYTVGWRVAAGDGHPVSGSYGFVVLATAVPSADTTRPSASPPMPMPMPMDPATERSAENLAYVATRFATFIALLVLIGTVAFKFGVLDRVRGLGNKSQLQGHARLARLSAGAAAVLIAAAAARLQFQQELLSDPSHLVHLQTLAADTGWGRAWLLQIGAAVVFGAAAWSGRRGGRGSWAIAGLAALLLAISASLGGHAAAATTFRGVGLVADGLHILGASAWLGGLTCLIIVGLPAATQAHDGRGPAVASMVNAFSPIALACAGLVVLTGATSAWLRLGGLEPLWTSAYGRVLLLKVGLMIGVAATGAYNWLRVKPALGTSESTVRLKKSATVELAVGVAVIAVTAFLVALPTPLDTP
jgi:copper transport protein